MSYFCWAHFPPAKEKGAQHKWTPEAYCNLLEDVDRAKYRSALTSIRSICSNLRKTMARYKSYSLTRLQHAYLEAKDIVYNRELVLPFYNAMDSLRQQYDENHWAWPPSDVDIAIMRLKAIESGLGVDMGVCH